MSFTTIFKKIRIRSTSATKIKVSNFSSSTLSGKAVKQVNTNPGFVGKFQITYLAKVFPSAIFYTLNGEAGAKIPSNQLLPFLTFLKKHTSTEFNQLRDISAIDYPERKFRFEIVYQLLSIKYNQRFTVSVSVSEGTALASVTSLYPSAG